ncbi:MAG: hypothetical protein FWH06_06890 [Oscillospiraceae bacterium]|nr:hypothetical protein [Oscillospiraceae bacterium]
MDNQKKAMTKREKFLISLTAAAVIFYLSFQFLNTPAFARHGEKADELEALAAEKQEMDAMLVVGAAIKEGYDRAFEGFEEVREVYRPLMPNERLDPIMHDLCARNMIMALSMNFSDPAAVAGDPSALFTVSVSVSALGTLDAVRSLLSDVDGIDDVRISRISFPVPDDQSDELISISLVFEVTMIADDL